MHKWGLGLIVFAVAYCLAADSSALPGGTWGSIQKLPDMSGVWEMTFGRGGFAPAQPLSLTPKYAAILKAFQDAPKDSPMANCVPPGMPGTMSQPYPVEILFTPGMVTVIAEAFMQVR